MRNQVSLQEKGLSSKEALQRLSVEGFNELPTKKSKTFLLLLMEIIKEPMFLLLLIAAILYLLLGDLQEGLMLLGFVLVSFTFTIFQERKTERAIEALRDLTSPRSLVIRDGEMKRIASREIVSGDIVVLSEGDRVSADGQLISVNDLVVNESLLTGEAMPIQKEFVGNSFPKVYSGTLVVKGRGIARVVATGIKSEIGRIGLALNVTNNEQSTLSKQTAKLVTQLSLLSLFLSLTLVLLYGFTHGNWLQAVLAGIALAMAILPEEYVVVMTLFPALGAWRLSKIKVLTRRLSSIETLGAISVLCVDKTGTLTENRMAVAELCTHDGKKFKFNIDNKKNIELPEEYLALVKFSILASIEKPYDPMEKAFHSLGERFLAQTDCRHKDWILAREYGMTPELRAMTHVWKSDDQNVYIIASKGSPEAIIDLCHLENAEKKLIENQVNLMASRGLRVLAVAEGRYDGTTLPISSHDYNFKFKGLFGLSDPLRSEVFKSVQECHQAGIKLVMITGDYPLTAKTIAEEAGLDASEILTGELINSLSDEQLRQQIKTASVCARISPEQKLRIVEAFKINGEITAMTGDGVNDAPALKAAHVGIAMGERGTDVAREAASLILLDDNFISIVKAVQLGRRIFDNMQKSMTYILAIHIPIAGMALLPVMFNLPALLFPMHIAFLELVVDPACSLAFENEPSETNIMNRPPRNTNALLMGGTELATALLQGFGALFVVMATYFTSLKYLSETEARSFTFSVLVSSNLALIFSNRSRRKNFFSTLLSLNMILWIVTGFTIIFLLSVLYFPFLARVFRFSSLPLSYFFLAVLIGLLSIVWFELVKLFFSTLKH